MLDRRSLLVAGASSLASIMLTRVPGSANAFILPFAPTEAYADEKDPFRVLVLSRTMFGVVVVDVANKNTPIAGAQVTLTSRYAAGKQLTATTDDEGTANEKSGCQIGADQSPARLLIVRTMRETQIIPCFAEALRATRGTL